MLNILAANPNLSQRQIAAELSISVGKTNYCIKALADKGWIKARSVRNSDNKLAYSYVLTPSGIRRKKQLAVRFFEQKRREFKALEQEIEMLNVETEDITCDGSDGT